MEATRTRTVLETPQGLRRRSLSVALGGVTLESGGKVGRLIGYAAVFDQWAVISRRNGVEHREIIRRTAFDQALAKRDEVFALVEHDPDKKLGRLRAGTLRLSTDGYGLRFEIDLPDTTIGRDAREDVRAGNLAGASFGYLPRPGGEAVRERMDGRTKVAESEITAAALFDVSVVGTPAYEGTTVKVRSRPRDPAKAAVLEKCRRRLVELGLRPASDLERRR